MKISVSVFWPVLPRPWTDMTRPWRSFCGKSPASAGTRPCGTRASCHRPAAAERPLMPPGAPWWSTPTQSRYIITLYLQLAFPYIPALQLNAPDRLDLLDSLLISMQSCFWFSCIHEHTCVQGWIHFSLPGDHERVKQVNVQFLKALRENKRIRVNFGRRWEM